MNIQIWKSFALRITVILLASNLLLGLTLTRLSIFKEKTLLEEALAKRVDSICQSLARTATIPLFLEDKEALNTLTRGFLRDDMVYVVLMGPGGKVLSETKTVDVPPMDSNELLQMNELTHRTLKNSANANIFEAILPIKAQPQKGGLNLETEKIGYARIGVSGVPIKKQIASMIRNNILTTLVLIVSVFILSSFLIHKMTNQMRNLMEKLRLTQELERSNVELEEFAYVVSHDLKAPLRAISTLASWLSTDYADKLDAQGQEQISLMIGRVKRMHGLIEGILHYSRVGRVQEKKAQVDLNVLLEEVLGMLDYPAHVRVAIEEKLPSIYCEMTRIRQVFQNLLSNSIKFMDKPEGIIKIGCEAQGGFWKFHVSDNGPGIEERNFEKIFQIFQTLQPRDKFESTGIGLTVVKKIIEMNGGKIWVESEVGQGSTFFFTLPMK